MKIRKRQVYDRENDILSMHFGGKSTESLELFDGKLIIDLDRNMNIVGIEVFNFMQELKKHDERFRRRREDGMSSETIHKLREKA